MIVGTSTNCSTINGSDRAAREGQDDDEEIMGTSITCSATGKSKRRKNSQHAVHHLRHGRIEDLHHRCKLRRILHEVPLHTPCGCTSTRSAGRIPGGSRVCPRKAWCSSRTSPSLALVPGFCPRRAAFGCALWCAAAARAMATLSCSCRQALRSRRSRRLTAAPRGASSHHD